jgi:DHA2 family multidrug resistance protein-like MFS transporter
MSGVASPPRTLGLENDCMTVSEKSRWLILLVVSSALFLIVIDMTVLYTAQPSLARDLGTGASEKL